MSDQPTTPTHLIYLLHFSEKVAGKSHYLGITRADRIAARLREHAGERGATLTALAMRQGAIATLVRLWPANGFEAERQRKIAGHYHRECPLCHGRLPDQACRAYPAFAAAMMPTPLGTSIGF